MEGESGRMEWEVVWCLCVMMRLVSVILKKGKMKASVKV